MTPSEIILYHLVVTRLMAMLLSLKQSRSLE